jgi:hypothetical protein
VLSIDGRDVEGRELALWFNKDSLRWEVRGDAETVHRTDNELAVVRP